MLAAATSLPLFIAAASLVAAAAAAILYYSNIPATLPCAINLQPQPALKVMALK
jgi:hypothetical protein